MGFWGAPELHGWWGGLLSDVGGDRKATNTHDYEEMVWHGRILPCKNKSTTSGTVGTGRGHSGCINPHPSWQPGRTEPMTRKRQCQHNLFSGEKMRRGKAQQQLVRYSTCNWNRPGWCAKGKKIETNQETVRISFF